MSTSLPPVVTGETSRSYRPERKSRLSRARKQRTLNTTVSSGGCRRPWGCSSTGVVMTVWARSKLPIYEAAAFLSAQRADQQQGQSTNDPARHYAPDTSCDPGEARRAGAVPERDDHTCE